jgi:1-deoxy-D-xylulose-5-phosphate reductoisomerase
VATVAVLGSTGSIGTQALDVVRANRDAYDVAVLGARSSIDVLARQAEEFRPRVVALGDETRLDELLERIPRGIEIVAGEDAMAAVAPDAEMVVNAVVGFAGLGVTLATLEAGHRLALANKESLIAGGPVVQRARATPGAELVPVDSEHSAIHQCIHANAGGRADRIARLLLTASGGPFRGRTRDELAEVTVDDALAHPTWRMGPKVTIDSSTLMNKGLEVIEAHELFGVGYDRVEVVVHPQSIVHSMVELTDGATIAQLSRPDMRLPIGYALAYPDRLATPFGGMDWTMASRLDFEPPDREAFPCLGLAYEAGRAGETAPAWLNAANEVAVAAFLDGTIGWLAIPDVLKAVLARHDGAPASSVEAVIAADQRARQEARRAIEKRASAA